MSDVYYSSYLQMTFWFGRKKLISCMFFFNFALFIPHTRRYFNYQKRYEKKNKSLLIKKKKTNKINPQKAK